MMFILKKLSKSTSSKVVEILSFSSIEIVILRGDTSRQQKQLITYIFVPLATTPIRLIPCKEDMMFD